METEMVQAIQKRTSRLVLKLFRHTFCLTNGRLNETASRFIEKRYPPIPLRNQNGILGSLGESQIKKITEGLTEDGYYIAETKLDEATCERMMQFSLSQPTTPYDSNGKKLPAQVFNRQSPENPAYYLEEQAIWTSPDAVRLLTDESLLAIAQAYLGCQPIQDMAAFWWSTASHKKPVDFIAQKFHFDMDRFKFLKIFFYITDVLPENGPHSYVARSHKRKPRELLTLKRLRDEQVLSHYKKSDILEFAYPRGTIILEDTAGLHKGVVPQSGDRLIFQLEFCNSLFGESYYSIASNNEHIMDMKKRYPRTFQRFERFTK